MAKEKECWICRRSEKEIKEMYKESDTSIDDDGDRYEVNNDFKELEKEGSKLFKNVWICPMCMNILNHSTYKYLRDPENTEELKEWLDEEYENDKQWNNDKVETIKNIVREMLREL